MKFIIDLWLDGYDDDKEMKEACVEFIEEGLDVSASSIKVLGNIGDDFIERILVYLEGHEDEGDYREWWKSDQLKRDINELIDILGLPEERKQRIY